ncbi:sulfatase family protein [Metabacillus halosaccharovorans]|uniref:sulfatase family protein n=1 Tax=Metabacillus halosaccharovorans TaxID=930124 RepID=UPI00203E331C|nr:sulfatase [Metabacillus halosaccharovorans]MCM3439462.1 sulfatase-like hydrolase/transferase [Metabacillus halosaccharovorans]
MKVIFISLDTLRAKNLGCYGYKHPTSPYIDQIAKEGVLFTQAYASDIPTEVAHTCIFTGKVGLTTGVVSHGSPSSYLPKDHEWLPTILRKAGFTTAAVDNLYHLKEWFARGYQYYMNTTGKTRWIKGHSINKLAKPWINEHKDEDFFLFLHYWDPHTPYLPPSEYIKEFYNFDKNPCDLTNKSMEPAFNHPAYPFFKRHHFDLLENITDSNYVSALYDAEIRYLDDMLKDLDEYLIKLGIKDDTLLVLFGDHGESLTEHDIYWDHCGLYEATVHVPMIMRWPGKIPEGFKVSNLVQHADLMPTLLEAIGLELPDKLDGKSLWPLILGQKVKHHSEIYLSECAWQAARGIRTDQYKYIETYDSGPFSRPPIELYDLLNDPNEETNLSDMLPKQVEKFKKQLNEWVDSKLGSEKDPMNEVLIKEGLPFKRRIEKVLSEYGMTWDEWKADPKREKIDVAVSNQS